MSTRIIVVDFSFVRNPDHRHLDHSPNFACSTSWLIPYSVPLGSFTEVVRSCTIATIAVGTGIVAALRFACLPSSGSSIAEVGLQPACFTTAVACCRS